MPLTGSAPSRETVCAIGESTRRGCGTYAVGGGRGDRLLPPINDADPTKPIYQANIGDELTKAGVSWAWYAGGWDNAAGNVHGKGWTNDNDGATCTDEEHSAKAVYPYCADALFQFHHQPFNYFANYAPGKPGRSHLQDEQDFYAALGSGKLPAVSFVKPDGEENEHPGYTSTENGESHLIDLLTKIRRSPQARIPALLIGGPLRKTAVDHASYDTTSVPATIEHRRHLAALGTRDAAVHDLGSALSAGGSARR